MPPRKWASEAERNADYRRRNREKILAYKRQYRANMTPEQKRRENDMRNERRRKNPEKYRAQHKEWRDNNREKVKAHFDRWKSKNPDYFREYEETRRIRPEGYGREQSAKLRARDPERARGYFRRYWRRLKEERPEEYRRRQRRNNARARHATIDSEGLEFVEILEHDICAYCHGHDRITIDHIDSVALGGGSAWTNLTAACKACNSGKYTRPLLEFLLR